MLKLPTVNDIRLHFREALDRKDFVKDKSGVDMLELCGVSFLADEPFIFGKVNEQYVKAEIEWYDSMSLNVNTIPGGPPKIWQQVATLDGYINSNYGWCIYSDANFNQYISARNELVSNPDSRRATMIYNRPSMHKDYCKNGCSDFMCTNAVQYLIRDNRLHAIVQMRSNDVVFGYKNDRAWQITVQKRLLDNINAIRNSKYEIGDLIWNASSLHVYSRHFLIV